MFVMTTKVNIKKVVLILAAIAAVILVIVLLFGGSGGSAESTQTVADAITDNDARVKYLTDRGWDVSASPAQSGQVRIPDKESQVFARYNALQKSQGFDLSRFAGKTVMRYVYKINNFPGATEPVYATLLIYKNQVIGGDVTDTAAKGVIQGLRNTQKTPAASAQPTDATAESTPASQPAQDATAPQSSDPAKT